MLFACHFLMERDCRGRTGLLMAARRGDAESVNVLLDAGANPNDADSHGTLLDWIPSGLDQKATVARFCCRESGPPSSQAVAQASTRSETLGQRRFTSPGSLPLPCVN